MGSQGSGSRKKRNHLPKVPKYEEPNVAPLSGLAPEHAIHAGREGHELSHAKQPGKFGQFLLRLLGKKPGEHI